MGKKDETNLAKKSEQTTALAGNFDYGEMKGDGWDNTSTDDFTIPFLAVIQAMSPQVQENEGEYIKDAKAGTFKQLVQGAEKCPVRIIHPGTPLNPREKDLDKWVKRAEPFN